MKYHRIFQNILERQRFISQFHNPQENNQPSYPQQTKKKCCNLCLTKKFEILLANQPTTLIGTYFVNYFLSFPHL